VTDDIQDAAEPTQDEQHAHDPKADELAKADEVNDPEGENE
jgi:hypothetical protein